ncbi:Not1 N-terminal domain, CCR4-Not complex component-domain-containing protein [Podospora fimiseda]|uniref:Not1 N-terminal domain, CCR4-Not complex component-domain-containing protein n=1 Tax=Podospora fimiseda TaxID=252190 RepID=A0AAN7BTT1_9PEZI|nr:Not1 N-terminal domain, CCR4-Not complex component-domain-containing protein [Podospora fimiseda]
MERFKQIEKAMKTKAYSKEGLSAAAKLDPKEQAKAEAGDFLSTMVDELEQQIETLEAEGESIQATMKKGKGQNAKAERIAEIERIIERHKWHQGKLELIRRSLENGGVEAEQVNDLEESIRYYVSDGMNDDFMEDDGMYDDLALDEEEDAYGMNQDNDKGSSQDTQSIQDETTAEPEAKPATAIVPAKQRVVVDAASNVAAARRPSAQLKSPLPTLATVHNNTAPAASNGTAGNVAMKPAALPTRPAEGLKYASAAAAAAASDKNNVGIAPLPPPPGAAPPAGVSPLPSQPRTSTTNSPSTAPIQPMVQDKPNTVQAQPPSQPAKSKGKSAAQQPPQTSALSPTPAPVPPSTSTAAPTVPPEVGDSDSGAHTNGTTNGIRPIEEEDEQEESIYHLPASLQDLVESYEVTKKRPSLFSSPLTQRMQILSEATKPELLDGEPPHPHPDPRMNGSAQFPQEPLPILDDPRLYDRIDPDTLFYVFYYKQGTYQQFLAARALKDQSWRFHKQYQTWFQRHEEPKAITEEFEQGTYRFFDYESTWCVIPRRGVF